MKVRVLYFLISRHSSSTGPSAWRHEVKKLFFFFAVGSLWFRERSWNQRSSVFGCFRTQCLYQQKRNHRPEQDSRQIYDVTAANWCGNFEAVSPPVARFCTYFLHYQASSYGKSGFFFDIAVGYVTHIALTIFILSVSLRQGVKARWKATYIVRSWYGHTKLERGIIQKWTVGHSVWARTFVLLTWAPIGQ